MQVAGCAWSGPQCAGAPLTGTHLQRQTAAAPRRTTPPPPPPPCLPAGPCSGAPGAAAGRAWPAGLQVGRRCRARARGGAAGAQELWAGEAHPVGKGTWGRGAAGGCLAAFVRAACAFAAPPSVQLRRVRSPRRTPCPATRPTGCTCKRAMASHGAGRAGTGRRLRHHGHPPLPLGGGAAALGGAAGPPRV